MTRQETIAETIMLHTVHVIFAYRRPAFDLAILCGHIVLGLGDEVAADRQGDYLTVIQRGHDVDALDGTILGMVEVPTDAIAIEQLVVHA